MTTPIHPPASMPTGDAPPAIAPPSISLALGGGGARGLAHILALEVLDELRLRPAVIAGTSIGALIGGVYALGLPAYRIRAIVEETCESRFDLFRQAFASRSEPVQRILRLLPLRSSFLRSETLLERLVPEFDGKTFADLKIPLKVVATDLVSREAVVIDSGPLRSAIAASIAIPLVFTPIQKGTQVLVDGGLVNPLPFDLITGSADISIAIDVSGAAKEGQFGERPTALEVGIQSLQIMEKSITRQKLARLQPDIYLDVDLDAFGALEFWRHNDILAAAAPLKEQLRRQLSRILAAPTLEASEPRAARQRP